MPLSGSRKTSAPSADGPWLEARTEPDALAVYGAFSRTLTLGYQSKIMLVAFVGTHVPLLTLLVWMLAESGLNWSNKLSVVLIALVATLAGTALTLLLLHHLLRPIVTTSRGLREYRIHQKLPVLPTQFTDDVGMLMSDVHHTLRKLDSTIRQLTYYNHETGLPNRTHFLAAVARLVTRRNTPALGYVPAFTVCVVEMVNFRRLATSLGLEQTTRLLRLAGQELEGQLNQRGHVSRLSERTLGFVLETDDSERLDTILPQLMATLADLGRQDSSRACYAAGAACHPKHGSTAGELVDNAQLALTEALNTPGSHLLYSSKSRSLIQKRYRLEHELQQAIELQQLRLYYQPVIDSANGRVAGAEALIRWVHPKRGLRMPDEFIPLAEHSDLIHAIGTWTLDAAGRQIRQWRDRDILPGPVAVNLSSRQFCDPDLPQRVADMLRTHGISGSDLELEITETSAIVDLPRSREILSAIKALGVAVAIDDFGTGYNSLNYLRSLPFDRLKIDRQFVQQLTTRPERLVICRALITLADGLGMQVVAEGVELATDVAALNSLGCTHFQGFHYSQAVTPADFEQLMDQQWQATGQPDKLTSA